MTLVFVFFVFFVVIGEFALLREPKRLQCNRSRPHPAALVRRYGSRFAVSSPECLAIMINSTSDDGSGAVLWADDAPLAGTLSPKWARHCSYSAANHCDDAT